VSLAGARDAASHCVGCLLYFFVFCDISVRIAATKQFQRLELSNRPKGAL